MNIFVLDKDPAQAAQDACDQHVIKMTLETAQILCAAFPEGEAPYKRTHYNHPCTIWSRESRGNYLWLIEHGLSLAEEYRFRYGKTHKSEAVIRWCDLHSLRPSIPHDDRTEFVQAMPDNFKHLDPVVAYRNFYRGSKARFARWSKARQPPYWWQASGE